MRSLFHSKQHGSGGSSSHRSSQSLTPSAPAHHAPPPPSSPRPPISSPMPPITPNYGVTGAPRSNGSTIQLVARSSGTPPAAGTGGRDEASYAAGTASAGAAPGQGPSGRTGDGRKPVLPFLSAASVQRTASVPGSPAESTAQAPAGGVGRKISVRRNTNHASPPPPSQAYHHLPPPRQPPDDDGLDAYSARGSRPPSMLLTPREHDTLDYAAPRPPFQPQQSYTPPPRKESIAAHQPPHQFFDQPPPPQQPPPPPQFHSPHPSADYRPHSQQSSHLDEPLMPQPSQSRGSVDTTGSGHPPLSREPSAMSGTQQPQYAQRGVHPSSDSHIQGQGGGGGAADLGRSTPNAERADSRQGGEPNMQQLAQEHETLHAKYRKVKNLYFERNAEIERLQNQLAHQRLSQSRTSLDDNEYSSRFERLDGAIKNVAFEIRQSWKTIPAWLGNVINAGAETKGGREMTVVGRASISRWVVDEILEQFFHPALEPNLSSHLKDIEHNIRRNAPTPQSIEEDDALCTRVCNWRLTTLDALHAAITGPHALEARHKLAEHLVDKLVSSLQVHLHEPAPPGLLGGVQMIVDIAIGLGANLPLESRDVRVWYPLPGERYDGKFMKSEGGLPPLGQSTSSAQAAANPAGAADETMDTSPDSPSDTASTSTAAFKDDLKHSGAPSSRAGVAGLPGQHPAGAGKDKDKSKTMGLSGKFKKALGSASGIGAPTSPGLPQPQQQASGGAGAQQQQSGKSTIPAAEAREGAPRGDSAQGKDASTEKVRVAGFMAVEVRGRSILVKAPVWL